MNRRNLFGFLAGAAALPLAAPEPAQAATALEPLTLIEGEAMQLAPRPFLPSYHVHWEPPEGLDDPDGTITAEIVQEMERAWQRAAENDSAFITAGTGIRITPIGAAYGAAQQQAPRPRRRLRAGG